MMVSGAGMLSVSENTFHEMMGKSYNAEHRVLSAMDNRYESSEGSMIRCSFMEQ